MISPYFDLHLFFFQGLLNPFVLGVLMTEPGASYILGEYRATLPVHVMFLHTLHPMSLMSYDFVSIRKKPLVGMRLLVLAPHKDRVPPSQNTSVFAASLGESQKLATLSAVTCHFLAPGSGHIA